MILERFIVIKGNVQSSLQRSYASNKLKWFCKDINTFVSPSFYVDVFYGLLVIFLPQVLGILLECIYFL